MLNYELQDDKKLKKKHLVASKDCQLFRGSYSELLLFRSIRDILYDSTTSKRTESIANEIVRVATADFSLQINNRLGGVPWDINRISANGKIQIPTWSGHLMLHDFPHVKFDKRNEVVQVLHSYYY